MKFGQLVEYNQKNNFIQKSYTKGGRQTSSRPLFVFYKGFISCKNKRSTIQFQYISIALNLAHNKNKLYKTFDYCSRNMLNFEFLEKGLGIFYPPHILCIIFQKNILSYILLTDQISSPGGLYFLRDQAMCAL